LIWNTSPGVPPIDPLPLATILPLMLTEPPVPPLYRKLDNPMPPIAILEEPPEPEPLLDPLPGIAMLKEPPVYLPASACLEPDFL